jgi:hypothetical protein
LEGSELEKEELFRLKKQLFGIVCDVVEWKCGSNWGKEREED